MSRERVSLQQIDAVPRPSWELPGDELYVKLGCVACPSTVCFTAKGITSLVPRLSRNRQDAQDLDNILSGVTKMSDVYRGRSSGDDEVCPESCSQVDDMQAALELLNDRFEADLQLR
jgi:hypothetical protein